MAELIEFQKSNCKNCYKCIRRCPVKSIRFSGNQAYVVDHECILCGQCYVVCPQNAKTIADGTEEVRVLLAGEKPVIASVAPSFAAYFEGVGFEALRRALMKLGFSSASETALGAQLVKKEYERIAREHKSDIVITSCCHTVNLLIEKYYPSLTGLLAPVVTPLHAHRNKIREENPDAEVVFIGPCLSKRDEASLDGVAAALTFDELSGMLEKAGVELKPEKDGTVGGRSRLFPVSGGILDSMTEKDPYYTYLVIDGAENCRSALEDISKGGVHRCFIEMSACVGSCVGGPVIEKKRNQPVRACRAVREFAGNGEFDLVPPRETLYQDYAANELSEYEPGEDEIREVLQRMGKFKESDELNCGTCGYDSCREKAVAVLRGKAEISMCLPFLMEKSERFSSNILNNTPNGILVVSEALEIQQINPAAMKMLHVNTPGDVLGEQVSRVMDPLPFSKVLREGARISDQRDYYAEYGKYLEMTLLYDRSDHMLLCLLRDVTEEEKQRRKKETFISETASTADKVVDKQMRIVQEIASLLGETAAETKIALSKLKESMSDDDQ